MPLENQPAVPPASDAIVDKWFNENFANGPIARDGATYAQAFAAKDKLKALLAPEKK